jgi:hypothetical protein
LLAAAFPSRNPWTYASQRSAGALPGEVANVLQSIRSWLADGGAAACTGTVTKHRVAASGKSDFVCTIAASLSF